jgi:pimeloyl-ACP methyl ester carboxylesterase
MSKKSVHLSRRTLILGASAAAITASITPYVFAANLNSESKGNGPITLLFVHGFGCNLHDWDAQVAALSSQYTCIAIDLPGFGKSQARMPTIESLADAVNEERKNIAGTVVLIGHSMGCRVVAEAARRFPGRLAGVVLLDGSWLGVGDPDAVANKTKKAIDDAGFRPFMDKLFTGMFVQTSPDDLRSKVMNRLPTLNQQYAGDLFVNITRWDASQAISALSSIKVPVLVLQATYINPEFKRAPIEDGMSTPWVDMVKKEAPKTTVRIITGSGHFAMMEKPDQTNQAILSFVKGLK